MPITPVIPIDSVGLRLSGLKVWQELRREFREILAALNAGADDFCLQEETYPQYKVRILKKLPYRHWKRVTLLGEIRYEANPPAIAVRAESGTKQLVIPFKILKGCAVYPGLIHEGSLEVVRTILGSGQLP